MDLRAASCVSGVWTGGSCETARFRDEPFRLTEVGERIGERVAFWPTAAIMWSMVKQRCKPYQSCCFLFVPQAVAFTPSVPELGATPPSDLVNEQRSGARIDLMRVYAFLQCLMSVQFVVANRPATSTRLNKLSMMLGKKCSLQTTSRLLPSISAAPATRVTIMPRTNSTRRNRSTFQRCSNDFRREVDVHSVRVTVRV